MHGHTECGAGSALAFGAVTKVQGKRGTCDRVMGLAAGAATRIMGHFRGSQDGLGPIVGQNAKGQTGMASIMLTGDRVGTIRVISNPLAASNSPY